MTSVHLTFGLLTLALAALWCRGDEQAPAWRRQGWSLFFLGAAGAAFAGGILAPLGCVWIACFAFAAHAFGRRAPTGGRRLVCAVAIIALSAGLMSHQLPGFNNPVVVSGHRFSPGALPFRLHLNFDKPLIGLFLLVFSHPLLRTATEWRRMLARAAPVAFGTIAVLLLLSVAAGYVRWEPKFPHETWLWMWVNLFFTCVAEEALFRGFIQAQLARAWQHRPRGELAAQLVAAALFGLAHAAGGAKYVALATVAGIGYGWVYRRTGKIEASILTHFALNAVHFFGFTYPALQR